MSSVEKRVVVLKFGGPKFQATMKGMHEAYTNEKSSRIGPQYQASCCGGLAPHTGSGGGSERQEQLCAGNADKSSKRDRKVLADIQASTGRVDIHNNTTNAPEAGTFLSTVVKWYLPFQFDWRSRYQCSNWSYDRYGGQSPMDSSAAKRPKSSSSPLQ